MQGLDWEVRYPDLVRGVIAIGSCARIDAQGMAWNAIARNAIMADPDWQGGDFYGTGRWPSRAGPEARLSRPHPETTRSRTFPGVLAP